MSMSNSGAAQEESQNGEEDTFLQKNDNCDAFDGESSPSSVIRVRPGQGMRRVYSMPVSVQQQQQQQQTRQPFHFSSGRQDYGATGRSRRGQSVTDDPIAGSRTSMTDAEHNMQIRYRLFNRLDPGGSSLLMPTHVVPPEFFSILPFNEFIDASGKQGSIVTIFSIWNTMMGTSLLAMPWALYQAGFVLGLFLMVSIAAIALYTAYRVVESPTGLVLTSGSDCPDFTDVCRYFWGRKGEIFAVVFSMVVLFGGVMVYWVLMSNFLYYTGAIIYEAMQKNSTEIPVMRNKTLTCDVYCPEELQSRAEKTSEMFNNSTNSDKFYNYWTLQGSVPVLLALIAFPLLNFKSPTFFTKFNMLGTISVVYLLFFTFSKLVECGVNMDFGRFSGSEHHVALFSWKFPALTGTLSLSYFIHNAVLNILQHQKYPENNARDLTIGYILATICYVFLAVTFYAAFPTVKSCIADNFLNNFGTGDVMSATARVFLLVQMFAVLPLLFYLIRAQLSYCIASVVYPGLRWVILINSAVISVSVLVAILYPHIGGILRYVGSFAGMVYIFALPCIVHLKRCEMRAQLTTSQLIIHGMIIALGFFNFVGQFAV